MIRAILVHVPSSAPLAYENTTRPSWRIEWDVLPEGDVVFRCARGYLFVVWRQQQSWAFRNCGDCCCCYMSCNFCLALHCDAQAGQQKIHQQFTSQGRLMTCTQLFNVFNVLCSSGKSCDMICHRCVFHALSMPMHLCIMSLGDAAC